MQNPGRQPIPADAWRSRGWRRWGKRLALVAAGGLLLTLLWLTTFSGRVFLFMLALARPEGWPNPQALTAPPPEVRRIDYPSESGRRMVADVYVPGGIGGTGERRPGILLLTPASRQGLRNPGVIRAARSFARLGYVTMVPFPAGEQISHLSVEDIADARTSLRQFMTLPELDPARSIGGGLSYGSGPLLLAATELPPKLRPSRYVILGGYADLSQVFRYATTGTYGYGLVTGQREPSPYIRSMLGRTLVAWAAPEDRPLLRKVVEERAERVPEGLSPEGRKLAALYLNQDPERFARLYAELSPRLRSQVDALSPVGKLHEIEARTFVFHARDDRFVPPSEALRLWDALPPDARGELLLPPALGHSLPLEKGQDPREFVRSVWLTYRFALRALYPTP